VSRTTLPTATAVTTTVLTAALLLTACSGNSSTSSGKISTAPPVAPTTTSAPSTQPTAPGAPHFDIPSDITVRFEGFDSSDPTKKAALTDATYAAEAVLEFEATTHTNESANFKRFWTGAKGAEYADSLISQGRGGLVITGIYRYYDPVVKTLANGGGNLSVTYCEDQRKAYSKDSKTGKVLTTSPSPSDFREWTLLMAKNSSGEWQVFDHQWVKGAKQCQAA
jgi:hypothetical protein